MSLILAPVPPEPLPWEQQDYEDNISGDEDEEDDISEDSYATHSDIDGYDSEDSNSVKSFIIKRYSNKKPEPVPYYKSILQEEEYFSE
jgi:hypothetical protein